ncbi:phenoloxidase-activating factor 2-like [Hyposmocoma kahamanoa]|uniref:phenoloxidase-activating factor 2-like n=1 Tax=Hyposmocoma kahamanoa TaxID=1477025 RepID=UPI000E6D9CA0|nr:phenoloxidase-activating factor 2-like [Hyposmocoma kahamanoa]
MFKFLLLSLLAMAAGRDDLESVLSQIFGSSTPATGNTGSGTNAGNIGGNLGNNNGPSTVIPPGTNDVPKNDSCTTVNNEKGKCVKYYLCDRNDAVFNASTGINLSVIVDRCSSYLDVCCRLPNQQFPDNQEKNESEQVPNSEAHRSGCGWRNPEGLGMKINSGTNGEANYGEFPWVVVVYSRFYIDNHANPDAFSYKGVGSLIHPSVVLTAAHILTNYDEIEEPEFQVRAGNWKLYPDNELYQHQDRHVESTLIHKDFNSGNVFYDAALLYLSRPMELAPNVGIACLPPPRERVAGGTQCFSSWWPRESGWEAILTKEQVQVVDYNSCRNDLRKTRLGEMSELHTSFMCTRDDRSSSVVDGAPLVCPIEFQDGRYMQSGIVALNVGSEGNMLYVDVSNIRDWIDDKVKGKGYSTREYSFNI